MTTFDRIERRLPELIDELAAATVPDYVDDMLRHTTRSRQRPRWSAPERWLPMGVIARTAPIRPLPWRSIAIAAIITLLAAATLIYAGSRTRVAPPFGPARNGVIVYGTVLGDIVALDPTTGTTRTLIGGSVVEKYPMFTLDGTRLIFARVPGSTASEEDYIAAADGSGEHALLPAGPAIKWFDLSGSGDRALLSREADGRVVQSMLDVASGRETPIPLDPTLGISLAMFRPGHDQVIYEHVPDEGGAGTTVWIARGDGGGELRPIAISADAVNEAWVSQDGSRLVYATWGTGVGKQGRLRVMDLDTGIDTALTFAGSAGSVELAPQFSPDGKRLVITRYRDHTIQLVVVPADGIGPEEPIGPGQPGDSGSVATLWSPDGSQVLAAYGTDGTVWLLPANGDPGRMLDGMSWDRGISWQRLAD